MTVFFDVVDFLRSHPPFHFLDEDTLSFLASRIQVSYFVAGENIEINDTDRSLRVIRSGSVEIRNEHGQLIDRVNDGACLGFTSLLTGEAATRQFSALDDGLLYLISEDDFQHLRQNEQAFDRFFIRKFEQRLKDSNNTQVSNIDFGLNLNSVANRNLALIQENNSIKEAAQKMTEYRASSVLVCDEQENITGIVTDRDLRTRVVAKAVDINEPVSSIMTKQPNSLSESHSLYDAYLKMMSTNIHHLPVTENNKAIGIITLSDILRRRNSEPLFLTQQISKAKSTADLEHAVSTLPELIENLVLAKVGPEELGRVTTSITDALTQRLIQLAEDEYGPAPCKYSWLAFGSQGREEQTLNSDQDNGLLLEDSATKSDYEYFHLLANFVCDGLNQCGIPHCPGDVMAKNKKWCVNYSQWRKYFEKWIAEPDPKAQMHISIFFDLRCLCGDTSLVENLKTHIGNLSKNNSLFLACMLENIMKNRPPLGFFKNFVLEDEGDHQNVLDLKRNGVIPIVDLARIYSLEAGIKDCSTLERLRNLKGAMHVDTLSNLCEAYTFINTLRLSNQQKQKSSAKTVTNYLNPKDISPLLRQQLKDAFAVIRETQQAAKIRFGHGVI